VDVSSQDLLNNPDSPQSKAADWIINNDPLQVNPCTFANLEERYALAVFYFALNGDTWRNNSGWLGGSSVCSGWFGVGCNANGQVTNLLLPRNNLLGEIPPEISQLEGLRFFQISESSVFGTLPTEIGSLQNLVGVDFGSNELEGQLFFDDFFRLRSLQFLRAPKNNFTGTIPGDGITSFPNLVEFIITANSFKGTIPTQIGQLKNLNFFMADNNTLTGPIPSQFGSLTSFRRLDVENNLLTGPIPNELFGMSTLEKLILSNNSLSGTIPSLVGELNSLSDLWVSHNDLTGEIPTEIVNAFNLEVLLLNGNDFNGPIPANVDNLLELFFVDFSNNTFSGTIPPAFFSLPKLEILYFSNNTLVGTIPPSISDSPKLRDLYLDGNLLSGSIPEIVNGTLLSLEELLLSFNDLTGTMPSSICALRNNSMPPGNLVSLHADCVIPPDPPEIICTAGCCTQCTFG